MDLKFDLREWLTEVVEMLVILGAIILLSRLFLGADMLVPLVAVTSQSMLHVSDSWKVWLQEHGISKDRIEKFPMQNGFAMGDMIVTITPDGEGTIIRLFPDTQLGDVIIYRRDKLHPGNEPIIHRVVGIVYVRDWDIEGIEGTLDCLSEDDFRNKFIPYIRDCIDGKRCPYREFPKTGTFKFFITKGDNNPVSDQCGIGTGIALPVNEEQLTARGWIRLPYIGWLKLLMNYILGI
ncbi:MAG: hypothetical protein DRO94_03270 [Candidatus Altiarchaeales archaeon]|nr:MAG: hypothetical protein DRO95_03945 [Candidatus Altiarchaeales archaeon]RLI94277.1 MAG: hypothetical protein DRO94_03270 [Candidatus Altiarchaeales archaeon]HDO82706.1 hypothetical protein [Candidatus Altiarchaeales archaeon]HEX55355.1 hypothetical protein [Candidatus Altiarchaeales archaeon]